MTDNEIIRSLEICANNGDCKECVINPHHGNYGYCTSLAINAALDLINRQKAEIERLQKECEITRAYIHNNGLEWGLVSHLEFYKNQKSEVIKEFAERLKGKVDIDLCEAIDCSDYLYDLPKLIDNLVKEMEKDK